MRLAFILCLGVLGTLQDPPPAEGPQPFDAWLGELIEEARGRGYSDAILEATVAGLSPLPRAIESDRKQPELTVGFERYFESRVNAAVVRQGRQHLRRHRTLLQRIERQYGVPARVVVAVWGMESRYGRNIGRTPAFQALATLAWEPRRSAFFRGQLFDALEMVSRGYIDADTMLGSWAGAMGQTQFMPSSYLEHAVDFDGDGRRDIWGSTPDALASIANYLEGNGWTRKYTWGREVKIGPKLRSRADALPRRTGGCYAIRDMTERRPLNEWHSLGVRLAAGGLLPRSGPSAGLVRVQDREFLVYPNYDALLRYNCAHHYALSVAMLSERLR